MTQSRLAARSAHRMLVMSLRVLPALADVLREAAKVSRGPELHIVSTHFHSEHTTGEIAFPAHARVIRAWERALCCAALAAQWIAFASHAQQLPEAPQALRAPDVRYEPSGAEVVRAMLQLGKVTARDVVYDLGCGDGRIVIAAARERGARGVCVDIDPQRIAESRDNARAAGVTDRIDFRNEDLFTTPIGDATVVMLFLYPDLNLKLRPKLWRDLKPGTRVVSHWHDMGDWKPLETVRVVSGGRERPIYFWTIPGR